jgi:hypothetical protein
MDKHVKVFGSIRGFHIPRTAYQIQRGTVGDGAIAIDGVLQLKSSRLLNGKGVLSSLTQNFHDFRVGLEEPD